MSSMVRDIFKILIKVPIVIFVAYIILNFILFGISYFKMMGIFYSVEQVACENNYIPADERVSLENYFENSVETELLENVSFTDGTTFSKQQYGELVTVGVQANYKFAFPLFQKDMINGEFEGYNSGNSFGGWKSDSELAEARKPNNCNIVFEVRVPGLAYYSDLE